MSTPQNFKSKAASKAASKQLFLKQLQKAAQLAVCCVLKRSASQRMCEHTYMQMQRSAAPRSAVHHMLRLEATCIYSAAQSSVCVNAPLMMGDGWVDLSMYVIWMIDRWAWLAYCMLIYCFPSGWLSIHGTDLHTLLGMVDRWVWPAHGPQMSCFYQFYIVV